jgi:SPX domain protein involved in polyphosphate accumulation
MAIEVFNRYEKKFFLNAKQYAQLQNVILQYMEPDKHNLDGQYYTICNLYYDTESNAVIRQSIQKPTYKEKLRLRGYGTPGLDSKVYVEIKKKVNRLVNKRRTPLYLHEAYDFLANKKIDEMRPHMNAQVVNEIAYFLSRNEVQPMVYLAYDRRAFFEIGNNDLRISFDTNIRTRRDELRLELGDHGRLLIDNDCWLMEIKTCRAMPLWLVNALSNLSLYPKSFSKYGTEYLQHVKNTIDFIEGEEICQTNCSPFSEEARMQATQQQHSQSAAQ